MTEIRNFCDKQMSDYQKRKEESNGDYANLYVGNSGKECTYA